MYQEMYQIKLLYPQCEFYNYLILKALYDSPTEEVVPMVGLEPTRFIGNGFWIAKRLINFNIFNNLYVLILGVLNSVRRISFFLNTLFNLHFAPILIGVSVVAGKILHIYYAINSSINCDFRSGEIKFLSRFD